MENGAKNDIKIWRQHVKDEKSESCRNIGGERGKW
jgi:hypothetical protein